AMPVSASRYGGKGPGPGGPHTNAIRGSGPEAPALVTSTTRRGARLPCGARAPARPPPREAPAAREAGTPRTAHNAAGGPRAPGALRRRRTKRMAATANAAPSRNGTRPHHRLISALTATVHAAAVGRRVSRTSQVPMLVTATAAAAATSSVPSSAHTNGVSTEY